MRSTNIKLPYVPVTVRSVIKRNATAMALSPNEVIVLISNKGVSKVGHSLAHVAVQGTMAGMYIGIGGLFATMVAGGCPGLLANNPGLVKLLLGAFFPVGLMMVAFMGADLFTGDAMYVTVSWLQRRVTTRRMLSYWASVYLANFFGSFVIVIAFGLGTGLLDKDPWRSYARGVAEAKMSLNWGQVLLRGIGGNWLVNVALFHSMVATDALGKMIAIWFPVMAFVTIGFEHSVADMYFVPMGLFCGAKSDFASFLWALLLPATLGNLIGGAVLVGLVQWHTFARKDGDRLACRNQDQHRNSDRQRLVDDDSLAMTKTKRAEIAEDVPPIRNGGDLQSTSA